jgi:hypothetical protein
VLSSAFARVESHSGWWTSWSTTPARVGVDDRRRGLAQQRTEAAAKEPIAQGIRLNAVTRHRLTCRGRHSWGVSVLTIDRIRPNLFAGAVSQFVMGGVGKAGDRDRARPSRARRYARRIAG